MKQEKPFNSFDSLGERRHNFDWNGQMQRICVKFTVEQIQANSSPEKAKVSSKFVYLSYENSCWIGRGALNILIHLNAPLTITIWKTAKHIRIQSKKEISTNLVTEVEWN